ncbi:hypothetical protein V5738_00900 [Salinisphaera sp. SPP-AMP-43]|uniref:ZIP family metal transporter n=1 Tax=Salinisphaera sp. SPP-AMP-43 TaxID=3121288 RepID=UPI003C6DB806
MNASIFLSRGRPRAGEPRAGRWLPAAALIGVWLLVLALGAATARDKLVVIGLMAGAAMVAGWWLAERVVPTGGWGIAVADGLAAGAMIASACIFLLPSALAGDARHGGLGVTAGLLLGIALDWLMRAHEPEDAGGDNALVAITLHAAAAGAAMGLAYAAVPSLSVLLGVVIVAHKLPAGYALARARQGLGRSRWPILAPSCAVGLVAIPVALWAGPLHAGVDNAWLSGLATGVFLHVGLDFARQPAAGQLVRRGPFLIATLGAGLAVVAAGFGFR